MTDRADKLHTYVGYSRCAGSEEGACLVFAHNAKEARKVAYPIIQSWWSEGWIDTAVRRLRDMPWLYKDANQDKLKSGIAHAVECPTCCQSCEMWGYEIFDDGTCDNCNPRLEK